MISERLVLMRDLLADDGSIFVHCDWHICHLMRVLLDEVFGKHCFANEIVVNRGRRKNLQKQFRKIAALGSEHDVVFLYKKASDTGYAHVTSSLRAGHWPF